MPIVARPVADDPATRYACNALDGKFVTGEFVKEACRRHLRDLDGASARGLSFDAARADHVCGFFPAMLTVTEGAAAGRPFHLLRWQEFVAGSLHGWRRADGLRRFRMAWMETGKGQAKSPFMAGTGIYMMGYDGKQRAECYAIAGDKDQAKVVFLDAVAMCRANMPDVEEGEFESLESSGDVVIRGTGDLAWMIEHPETSSKFLPIASADSISGPRPYLVVADEIHEFKSAHALTTWKAAIDKMSGDPLMMLGTNTPAINQIVGTEYSDLFQRVVTGQAAEGAAGARRHISDRQRSREGQDGEAAAVGSDLDQALVFRDRRQHRRVLDIRAGMELVPGQRRPRHDDGLAVLAEPRPVEEERSDRHVGMLAQGFEAARQDPVFHGEGWTGRPRHCGQGTLPRMG